ncbi:MAG: DHH family phosphoesterase [Gemmatimonadetes bacterium]|nr:DHH family phosphoesterase [Gemmatimonadota bacterium]
MTLDLLAVPLLRRSAIDALVPHLLSARTVALSTHINADGDGCGSEVALALLLAQKGIDVRIVNPTPWPAMFNWLLESGVRDESARGAAALREADRLVVLDISDVRRLGGLADAVRSLPVPPLVIDHHLPGDEPPGTLHVTDTTACATGELVFDLAVSMGVEITPPMAGALYAALMTDTGGFRFSNTSARCLAVASQLVACGVDPEEMYRRIYASVPIGRLRLISEALRTIEADFATGIATIEIEAGQLARHNVTPEDLDGVVEYPRSIEGIRLALLFRDLGHGKVKVSFRTLGTVDANQLARRFGGGGHAKAAGALVEGSLAAVKAKVTTVARDLLKEG